MKQLTAIVCFVFFIVSCKDKNKDIPPEEEQPAVVIPVNTGPGCQPLPPEPLPYGWQDSTTDVNKNINAFFFNPINPNEVIYVVNGDITGYNKMFCYNIPLKITTPLGSLGPYTPKINKKGWIVFSSVDNEIYKIKSNGDSLTRLTFGNINIDPQWDYTGDNIYFFRLSHTTSPSMIIKITSNGAGIDNFAADMSNMACFRRTNQMIYLKPVNSLLSMVLRDTSKAETILFTTTYNPQSGKTPFEDMCIDIGDQFLFWSNTTGIFKCNLSTLKIDTVLKNCPNFIYENPIVSFQTVNEITVSRHSMTALYSAILYHEFKAIEMNLLTKELNEIKIFP